MRDGMKAWLDRVWMGVVKEVWSGGSMKAWLDRSYGSLGRQGWRVAF